MVITYIKYTKRYSHRLYFKLFFEKVTSHFYDYKASLQIFAPVSASISFDLEELQGLALYLSFKHVSNNHNTFLALSLLFNQFQCKSVIIKISSLKLLKFQALWNVQCPFLSIMSQLPLTFLHHVNLFHNTSD